MDAIFGKISERPIPEKKFVKIVDDCSKINPGNIILKGTTKSI